MALAFIAKITGKGNIKLGEDIREILGVGCGDTVRVVVEPVILPDCEACPDVEDCPKAFEDEFMSYDEGFPVPEEIFDEAGIDMDGTLEIYATDGAVIIQEAYDE